MRLKLWILPLLFVFAAPLPAKPSKVVFGYSASWQDGYYPPTSYHWDALSHVSRSFLLPQEDGSIEWTNDFFNESLTKLAKKNGVKLIASLGGASVGSKVFLKIAADEKATRRLFDELEKLIGKHGWDGVDIDWEPAALNKAESDAYLNSMKKLRARFPKWEITTALPIGNYWAQHQQWEELIPLIDYLCAMTYDNAGDWAGRSSHDNGLYLPECCEKDPMMTGVAVQGEHLVKQFKVPREKILLGLRFDAYSFGTKNLGDKFGKGNRGKLHFYNYNEVEYLKGTGAFEQKWDKGAKVPYLEKKKGQYTVTFNNARSIKEKCEFVKDKGYAGVIIWALGGDVLDNQAALLNATGERFGVKPALMRDEDLRGVLAHRMGKIRKVHRETLRNLEELKDAGKEKLAKKLDPGALPKWAQGQPGEGTLKEVKRAEKLLAKMNLAFIEVDEEVAKIPVVARAGKKIGKAGEPFLLDDFEDGNLKSNAGGTWMVDVDKNGLGSTISPNPLTLSEGGAGNSKYHVAVTGHFGKNVDPWPMANVSLPLLADGKPADLSGFGALEFMAKADGKQYEVLLKRKLVKDFCHFRVSFTAGKEWTKVTLPLNEAVQPKWGKQLEWTAIDLTELVFSLDMAKGNDEDFELHLDDIRLIP